MHHLLRQNEKPIVKVRKHWFIFLMSVLGLVLAGLIPPIVVFFLLGFGVLPESLIGIPAIWTYAISVWLLFVWLTLLTIWTNYYLDLWIVTDRRIIHMNQTSLFKREVTTTRLERVQDVTVKQHGILQTLLNFGAIRIQTAGEDATETQIRGIPNPSGVRDTIMRRVDETTENHMNNDSQFDKGVCHDTHQE